VLNHCGDGHWAFRDVVENERESDFVNWFSVESFPVRPHPVPNYRTCSGCYYLPKWNAYNPEVRDHHYEVARYWIEQGIDGWRLDVPYFINHEFWRGFREVVKGIDDDLYIVAEEWRDPEEWLQGDLADGTMNYTLRDIVLGFTADRSLDAAAFAEGMNALTARIPAGFRSGMLNLLGSHDTERVLTRHDGDERAALLAYALLFSAEGAPMIYYGDEVGLEGGNDPECRGTMPWNRDEWSESLLAAVSALGRARSRSRALRRGAQRVVAIGEDVVMIIRGADDGETVVGLVNRGPAAELSLDALPKPPAGASWHILLGAEHELGPTVQLPAETSLLLTTAGAR
jgi:glycosidase